jgi:hemoglobin
LVEHDQRLLSDPMTSLYNEIGGADTLRSAIPCFFARAMTDPALTGYFKGVEMGHLAYRHAVYLAWLLGGPEPYQGPSLRDSHGHLAITDDEFDTAVTHLVATLASHDLPDDAVTAIVDRVEPLRPEVVAEPPDRPPAEPRDHATEPRDHVTADHPDPA